MRRVFATTRAVFVEFEFFDRVGPIPLREVVEVFADSAFESS